MNDIINIFLTLWKIFILFNKINFFFFFFNNIKFSITFIIDL